MLKVLISSVCFLIIIVVLPKFGQKNNGLPSSVIDSSNIVRLKIYPSAPLIEKDQVGQYLNFDLTLNNTGKQVLELCAVELSVVDGKGKLILRKFLNQNGQAPSINVIGNTVLIPGETINIFNPFYEFPPGMPLSHLNFHFYFNYADNAGQKDASRHRLPFDYDLGYALTISPRSYTPTTTLYLPLKGKLIVWDGHDYYAHHRRFPVGLPKQQQRGITANSNRYAYDFISLDNEGRMYKNDPFKKENWYVFGKPVYAPGSGVVVEAQNHIPDNEFQGKNIRYPDILDSEDPMGMGNHLVIDHGNGEFSVILHMEKGTVKFKVGDHVSAGQQIGNVGFSGDAICPHVHYTVMNGPKEQVCEGVPSNFNNYRLFQGNKSIMIKRGRIDTGDIILSN